MFCQFKSSILASGLDFQQKRRNRTVVMKRSTFAIQPIQPPSIHLPGLGSQPRRTWGIAYHALWSVQTYPLTITIHHREANREDQQMETRFPFKSVTTSGVRPVAMGLSLVPQISGLSLPIKSLNFRQVRDAWGQRYRVRNSG